MSVIVVYRVVCDFCGINLADEKYVMMNHEEFKAPQPPHHYRYFYRGAKYDLCDECSNPMEYAKQKRIEELRKEGRLKGYPE